MSNPARGSQTVRFGAFEADFRTGELLKHGLKIKIQERPFRVLTLLLEHAGEMITREELRQKLWTSDTFVDFDHGISTAINKVREALCDSTDHSRFIETVASRGYRFIAPVVTLGGGRPGQKSADSSSPPRLVVLPFEALSGELDQDYFGEGFTDEMITQLGRIPPNQLGVIARTSAMHYKGSRKGIDQIGRELGVQYLLEGSIRLAGEQVRITARLVCIGDQTQLWAGIYDRGMRDILAVQSEVAQAIAKEIQINLTPETETRLALRNPVNPKAYEAYLQGRFHWNKRTPDEINRGIEYFRLSIDCDAGFAPAHAGLADSFILLGSNGYDVLPPCESMPKARDAAKRAVEIDESLAEAHTSLASISLLYDRDWGSAEREFQRALQLNSGYPTAYQWYSFYLTAASRFQEAIDEGRRALELDPLSIAINAALAQALYYGRQYDEAIAQSRQALQLDRTYPLGYLWLGRAYIAKGRYQRGIIDLEKGVEVSRGSPTLLMALGHAYAVAGRKGHALRTLNKLKGLSKRKYVPALYMAAIYAGLDDIDATIAWLEKAVEQRSDHLVYLQHDPGVTENLRSDRRFQNIIRRLGFPSNA